MGTDFQALKKQAAAELDNEKTWELFTSRNHNKQAQAEEIGSNYLRSKAREDIIWYGLMEPNDTTKEDLDPQVHIEDPVVTFMREPWLPAPVPVPFGGQPYTVEIMGNMGAVIMSPVGSPRQRANKFQIMNYPDDFNLRDVLTKLMLFDIGEQIDSLGFAMVDEQLGGSPGATVPEAGGALWKNISGGFTRSTFTEFLKILPDADNQFGCSTVVMNRSRSLDFLAWPDSQLSGSFMEKLERRGFVEEEFMDVNLIITIKNNIIPNNRIYGFAEENSLGQTEVLDDVTMYSEAKVDNLEWESRTVMGSTIQGIGCCSATLS